VDGTVMPPDAAPPIVEAAETPGESDEDAEERADRVVEERKGKPYPVPPLPPQPIPKNQPAQLCKVVGQVIAAAPKFTALRTKEPFEQRAEDLRVYKSTVQLGHKINVEIHERGDEHVTWEATWPRVMHPPKMTALAQVLPILRGCKELAAWSATQYVIELATGGSRDQIDWERAGKPTVTLIDEFDLSLRVQ
jgi:hypothetical protein